MLISLRLRLKISGLRVILPRRSQASTNTAAKFTTYAARGMAKLEEKLFFDDIHDPGYAAVHAGSIIVGDDGLKYEAVRKLGWGVNSTVWMGRNHSKDKEATPNIPNYMALKILNKDAIAGKDPMQANELQMLLRSCGGREPEHRPQKPSYDDLGWDVTLHPGWYRMTTTMGAFVWDHDNSQHLVIVSPLYGETMKSYMRGEPGERLTPAFAKQVARDTLQALEYLHDHCGIIHTDVKPENLLRDFDCGPDIDSVVEIILKIPFDAERSSPLWLLHVEDPKNLRVVLADLSHACWNDRLRTPRGIGSAALRAPELVMCLEYTTAIDIWAFGCTMFELLTGDVLFQFSDSRSPNELQWDPQYHLNLMQSLIGEPFSPMAANGTITIEQGFVDENGWIKSQSAEKRENLDERLARYLPEITERALFGAFLRRCLRLNPGDRASALELLGDPWLKSA